MGIVRPIVKTVGGVPKRVRDLNRLREVAQILVKHGFGALVAGVDIPGFAPTTVEGAISTPQRAVAAVQALGPTFVKLGQVLSTRPDLLPEEYITALQTLQDDVLPLSMQEMEHQLARELGSNWRDDFAAFSEQPIATASIAQVHGATLHDGKDVVLKIQRPGIERIIRSDLSILHVLVTGLVNEFPELNSVDVTGTLAEFERSLIAELDFTEEAKNMVRVKENFGDDPKVKVPEVFDDLTTSRVLCMERLYGVRIRDAREHGHDMAIIGERFLSCAYDMLFVHGLFHGDLHPGNVLILPGDVIGLLDFGMVGRLTHEMRNDIIFIIFALQRGDHRSLARLFYEIAIKTKRVDYRAVERDTVAMLEKHWSSQSMKDLQIGPYVMDLAKKATEHGARVPSNYTMFFKALVTTEGLAKSLIPEVDPIESAEPYIRRLIGERIEPKRLQADLMYTALTMNSVLKRLPVSIAQLLEDLDAQRLRFEVVQVPDSSLLHHREQLVNRVLFVLSGLSCFGAALWALDQPLLYIGRWPLGSLLLSLAALGFASLALARGLLRK